MLKQILLFLLLTAGWNGLFAQQAMSLNDCRLYALNNHPQVKIAQMQVADADWQIKENTASGLPQIKAGATYTGFLQRAGIPASAVSFGSGTPPPDDLVQAFDDNGLSEFFPWFGNQFAGDPDSRLIFSPVHSLAGNVEVSQLLFSNTYLTALKAARYYRDYVNVQLEATKQSVQNGVADAYLPALLISENILILDKNIANVEKLRNEIKAVNQAGFAEQLDVDRLDLSLSTLRSERNNLSRQFEIVVNALKMTMGMPIGEQITLNDNIDKLMAEYASVDPEAQVNFMNRPEYAQVLKGRELSVLQMELYAKPYLPTVAGFIQYQPGFQGGFGSGDSYNKKWFFIPSAVAGVSVSFNIWDGGGNKARKQRALIGVQTVDVQKSMLENAINLEVENARKALVNARERVSNQQQNLELAQRIYETTQKKYRAGVGSSLEVTQAESELYRAQQAWMSARYDELSARVTLKRSLGQ